MVLPASLWTESTCVGLTCSQHRSANFTVRLIAYRNAKLFPIGRADHDVITDVITITVGKQLRAVQRLQSTSVCPSVRHTPVFCQNEGTQRDAVFTIGWHSASSFLTLKWLMVDDPVQVKFECKDVDLLRKQPSCTHFTS